MKNGKYVTIGNYQNVKIGYGTVDYKNLKTIYVSLKSWIQPTDTSEYNVIISKTRTGIKNYIYNINNNFFQKQSIVDIDIRTNGLTPNKKSFMDIEITLFVKNNFDLKSKEIKDFINNICESIINNNLSNKNLFNFHINKK